MRIGSCVRSQREPERIPRGPCSKIWNRFSSWWQMALQTFQRATCKRSNEPSKTGSSFSKYASPEPVYDTKDRHYDPSLHSLLGSRRHLERSGVELPWFHPRTVGFFRRALSDPCTCE